MSEREIPNLMTHRRVFLFIAVAGSIGLATAQSSQTHSSSTKTGPDSLKSATAPLTPKSAMPRQSKSSVAVPSAPTTSQKTPAELTRLERQNIRAAGPKSNNAGPAKVAPAKSEATPSEKLDFRYQKPVGGITSARPDARSASSSTPRVTKKN